MTTHSNQQTTTSIATRLRDNQALRYMIAGTIVLVVSIINLVTVVQGWSAGWSFDIVSDNAMPFASAALGAIMLVAGIVKSRRR